MAYKFAYKIGHVNESEQVPAHILDPKKFIGKQWSVWKEAWLGYYPVVNQDGVVVDAVPANDPWVAEKYAYYWDERAQVYRQFDFDWKVENNPEEGIEASWFCELAGYSFRIDQFVEGRSDKPFAYTIARDEKVLVHEKVWHLDHARSAIVRFLLDNLRV